MAADVLYEAGNRRAVNLSDYEIETLVAVTLTLPWHRQHFSISSKPELFSFLRLSGAVQLEKPLEMEAHTFAK